MMCVEQPQLHWVCDRHADIIYDYSQSPEPPARGSAGACGTALWACGTALWGLRSRSRSLPPHWLDTSCCYVCCPSLPAPPLQLPLSSHSQNYPLLLPLHARTDCPADALACAHIAQYLLHCTQFKQCTLQSISTVLSPS